MKVTLKLLSCLTWLLLTSIPYLISFSKLSLLMLQNNDFLGTWNIKELLWAEGCNNLALSFDAGPDLNCAGKFPFGWHFSVKYITMSNTTLIFKIHIHCNTKSYQVYQFISEVIFLTVYILLISSGTFLLWSY